MNNKELIILLRNAVELSKEYRIQKFMKNPKKMISSKILEFFAPCSKKTIKIKTDLFLGRVCS
jgi:hypothetical protein